MFSEGPAYNEFPVDNTQMITHASVSNDLVNYWSHQTNSYAINLQPMPPTLVTLEFHSREI